MLSLFAASLPFSRDESTQWVVLAAAVLATLYVVMRTKSRAKRVDPLSRPPAPMGLAQQRQVERDIGNLMVEMLETARQMTAQLDTRAAKLDLLIRQADERLDALKTAGSAVAQAPAAPRTTNGAGPQASPDDRVPATANPAAAAAAAETPPDPRYADIYAMSDSGRSPHEIARSLDRPNGEVELILALRRN